MMDIKEGLLLWFTNFLNEKLADELHKPITKKIEKKNSLFWIQWQHLGCWFSWYAINKQI